MLPVGPAVAPAAFTEALASSGDAGPDGADANLAAIEADAAAVLAVQNIQLMLGLI